MLMRLFYIILCQVTWRDIKEKKIRNKEVLLIFGLGVLRFILEHGKLWQSQILGSIIISGPMLLLAIMFSGSIGGGDIKLMAAGGFFLGQERIVRAAVLAIFSAGVYCVWMLIKKKGNRKTQIALGPFLCLGMFVTFGG